MLKRGNWSVEELTKLRRCFGRRPLRQLARDLRRTPETVCQKANQLLGSRCRTGAWSADEVATLREMVGVADLDTMALVLGRPGEEVASVLEAWAARSRRGRFERWEIGYLKAFYSSREDWAVAVVTGRSLAAVRKRARLLCLGKDRRLESVRIPFLEPIVEIQPMPRVRMPRWTRDEIQALRRIYPSRANLDVAKELGRSIKSVLAKANELGLRKTPARLRDMGRANVGVRHGKRS